MLIYSDDQLFNQRNFDMGYPFYQRILPTGLLLCALAALAACDNDSGGDSGFDTRISVRDQRYCEILAVYQQAETGFFADVWNTWGLNECPQQDWDALDEEAIQLELQALRVQKNGPRYWTLDALSSAQGSYPELRSFGNIQFGLAAEVVLGPTLPGNADYVERTVRRDTEFDFFAGTSTYQLIAPLGKRYVMQSYAQIDDPTLSLADLNTLAVRLNLPTGWEYRVSGLTEDLLVEDYLGLATVVQDDLSNTYQRSETLEELSGDLVLVEILNQDEDKAWSAFMSEQEAAVLLVDFPWVINRAEALADKIVYSRSPDALADGRFEQDELFGHNFTYSGRSAVALEADPSGLISTGVVRKFQELTYDAGSVVPYLINSIGEHFVLVSTSGSIDPTEPLLPAGWSYAEIELAEDWRLNLNGDVAVVEAASGAQSYQGPVFLPLQVSPAGAD